MTLFPFISGSLPTAVRRSEVLFYCVSTLISIFFFQMSLLEFFFGGFSDFNDFAFKVQIKPN
jgi:hypothetical protein